MKVRRPQRRGGGGLGINIIRRNAQSGDTGGAGGAVDFTCFVDFGCDVGDLGAGARIEAGWAYGEGYGCVGELCGTCVSGQFVWARPGTVKDCY
jgi:hypothetical protein